MKELLIQLLLEYDKAGIPCGKGMQDPVGEEEFTHLAEQIGQPIHSDLRSLWRICGGQKRMKPGEYGQYGDFGLLGLHRLLSPTESLEKYQLIWDCEPEVPPPLATPKLYNRPVLELVPFASWDAYILCIHSISGEVWEFIPSPGLVRQRPCVEAVLQELLEVVRSGSERPDLKW